VSRRNKKKRLSRKFRKLHQIGKPAVIEVPPVDSRVENAAAESEKTDAAPERKAPPAAKPVYVSLEEEKSREIMGNLKTVFAVSGLCLVILGILYFLELRGDWVAGLDERVKSLMSGWAW